MLAIAGRSRGVTLVELMIGIAIVGFLLVMGLPSFSGWLQSGQIRTAAEAIQNGLQLARAEAVRLNTTVQFVLGSGSSWSVGCVTASATCSATIQSRASAEGSANAVVTASEVVASTGAAAASPVFSGTVVFNGTGRVTTGSLGAGNNAVFAITNPTGGECATTGSMRCLNVIVTSSGQVRMCDPALASSNPRGC